MGSDCQAGGRVARHSKARIRDLDKAVEDATNLIGKLPIKALETKLMALTKERDAAAKALEEANMKVLLAASAPTAFESIKETLGAFGQLGADYTNS